MASHFCLLAAAWDLGLFSLFCGAGFSVYVFSSASYKPPGTKRLFRSAPSTCAQLAPSHSSLYVSEKSWSCGEGVALKTVLRKAFFPCTPILL